MSSSGYLRQLDIQLIDSTLEVFQDSHLGSSRWSCLDNLGETLAVAIPND